MLQKRAVGTLSVNGATYIRFCYALPFAWLYLTYLGLSRALPEVSLVFLLHCLVAGLAQILGTSFLIASFAYDKFAVDTTFSKTEVALTALFGFIVLEGSMWRRAWVNGVDMMSRGTEMFRLIQNKGLGLIMQGTREWRDYSVSASVTPHLARRCGIESTAFRCSSWRMSPA